MNYYMCLQKCDAGRSTEVGWCVCVSVEWYALFHFAGQHTLHYPSQVL